MSIPTIDVAKSLQAAQARPQGNGVTTDYRDQTKSGENFIKLGDLTTGLGTHADFEDYIIYHALSFQMDKPFNPIAHEKMFSSGTVTMSNVQIIISSNEKLPEIYQKFWTGDKIDEIITKRTENTGGSTLQVIETLTFKDNYFTYVGYQGDFAELCFRTLDFSINKTPTDQQGVQGGNIEAGFNFKENTLAEG